MSTAAGVIISDVLRRVRDPQAAAHSRTVVRSLLAEAQKVTNAILEVVLETSTLSTEIRRLVYPVRANFPNALKIRGVRHSERDLPFTNSIDDLRSLDNHWPRSIDSQYATFTTAGRDVLILYPGLDRSSTVSVTYVKDTGTLASESTTLSIPEHTEPLAADILEVLLLMRQRDFEEATKLLENLPKRIEEVS